MASVFFPPLGRALNYNEKKKKKRAKRNGSHFWDPALVGKWADGTTQPRSGGRSPVLFPQRARGRSRT